LRMSHFNGEEGGGEQERGERGQCQSGGNYFTCGSLGNYEQHQRKSRGISGLSISNKET
jgi:hypothetical protein